ncbi:MAG: peptide synthetase, partial [Legionella sp.]
WQLMAVYCLFFLSSMDNLSLSRELEMLFLYLFLLVPSFSIGVAVIFKWLLLGRVKPGVYPLWGWFYYRWWLVNRLVYNSFFYKYMLGTPLVNIYHRLLGAKIGKNCHIATREIFFFDQFSLGDYSSLGIDSKLNGYIVEDGWLKIGAVEIGEHCYIGSRSVVGINTRIADEVILEEMSMVSDNSSLPSGYYMGSPIRPAAVPTHHVSTREAIGEDSSILENTFFGFMHYLGIIFLMLSTIVSYLPGFAFVDYFYNHTNYVTTIFFAIPVGAVLCLSMHYLFIIAAKKLILNKVQPGFYSLRSFYYLRYWFINDLLDTPDVSILSDSIYLPMLFRLLGAKLGAKVEMGEAPNVIPDLLTIKDGGFVASSVAMGWPQVYGNKIFFAPVTVGKKAFVGNVSFLSGGKTIGDGGLLGCLSLSPTEHQGQQPGSSWLGSPAMFLPNRESFVGYSDATTYNPSKKLYFTRALIEFIRIIIPTAFNLIILYHLFYLIDFMVKTYSWITISLVLPTFELFIVTLLIASLVGLKWVVVGKLKPITKPLWDSFIWKNDLVEFTFSYFINPNFNDFATGSPFIIWVARCFGSKIGKRVFCDTEGFAEFDLIEIGDEVCINRTSLLQTHLYEDRVFKVSTLTIRSGCNVGTSSIILYNTLMEENSSLGNLSLIMKGEYLPTNTQWVGIPAQSLRLSMSYNEQSKETIPDIAEVIKGTVTV